MTAKIYYKLVKDRNDRLKRLALLIMGRNTNEQEILKKENCLGGNLKRQGPVH